MSSRPLGAGWPAIRRWKVTGEDRIDGVELAELARRDRYALAHRTTSGTSRWQVTWFDATGPGGDVRRQTLEQALNDGAPASEYAVTAIHTKDDRMTRRPNPEPQQAMRMFRRFHGRDWRGEGEFAPSVTIPDHAICMGDAVNVLYRSDKLNPSDDTDEGWIDYIHDHDPGVKIYRPSTVRGVGGLEVPVPAWLQRVDQVTWLGACLGYAGRSSEGRAFQAKATDPKPELYAIPSGKALLVVQSKRTLLAMIWGGRLGVERRGIVH